MIFHILVRPGPDARLTAFCADCARRHPHYRPLREPSSERGADGRLLAGPVVTRKSEYGKCANCGASDVGPVGYLRCCAFCNADLLLDHEVSNEIKVYCPKHRNEANRR